MGMEEDTITDFDTVEMDTHVYRSYITSISDGDTFTVDVDVGFGITIKKQKLRLYGINTPEVRGDSREEGKRSRDIVREKLLNKNVIIKTIKTKDDMEKKGKYGRYLAIVFLDGKNMNDWIIKNALGVAAEY